MNAIFITAIGFLAQGFFSARILVQWIMSERAKRVLSPSLFWVFSLMGAYLLCLLLVTPLAAIGMVASNATEYAQRFLYNDSVPLWLLLFGSAGQFIFTMRFVYQWYYSHRLGMSKLPAMFWILSLVGSLSIVSYGFIRHDIVLIIGQSFGLVAYTRNLCLLAKATKADSEQRNNK